MSTQRTSRSQACRGCGRRVEIPPECRGRLLACGHCGGRLVDGGRGPDANARRIARLLREVDRRLGVSGAEPPCAERRWLPRGADGRPRSLALPSGAEGWRPTVLVAEHRDDVIAGVAAQLRGGGLRIVRARNGFEAMKQYGLCAPRLVVANVALPDHSGWLLAGKLRFVDPDRRIWLYQSRTSATDVAKARFLEVEELVEYADDPRRLARAILDCLAGAYDRPLERVRQECFPAGACLPAEDS